HEQRSRGEEPVPRLLRGELGEARIANREVSRRGESGDRRNEVVPGHGARATALAGGGHVQEHEGRGDRKQPGQNLLGVEREPRHPEQIRGQRDRGAGENDREYADEPPHWTTLSRAARPRNPDASPLPPRKELKPRTATWQSMRRRKHEITTRRAARVPRRRLIHGRDGPRAAGLPEQARPHHRRLRRRRRQRHHRARGGAEDVRGPGAAGDHREQARRAGDHLLRIRRQVRARRLYAAHGPSGPMTMNPAIYSKLPYEPLKDFAPVSMIGDFPLILVVSASLPANSVKALIAYAKARPDKVNYAASAAPFQLAAELFNQKTGTKFVHIPYKSSAESVGAVMSGQVTMTIMDPPPAIGPLKGGKVRGLAVTSPSRHPSRPDGPH